MKLILLLSLLVLVSCNEGGDGGSLNELPPTGILNKEWVSYTPNGSQVVFSKIDLTDMNNIKITGLKRVVKTMPPIGSKPIFKVYTSDCVYSSTGTTPVHSYYLQADTTLVSGDPKACDVFVPVMIMKHFKWEHRDFDTLTISSIDLK